MVQQYIKQHKRGRKSCYTGIPRGSSFFVVLARCGSFPRTFPPHWKKYARKHEKGLYGAIFRHWQQANTLFYKCTTKLFLLATSKRKKQIFRKNKALECAEWRVFGRLVGEKGLLCAGARKARI